MKSTHILIAGELRQDASATLAGAFTIHHAETATAFANLPQGVLDSIRGASAGHGLSISGDVIAAMPALEIIANFGVGYDAIDVTTAAARGIVVTNTPDVLTGEVADTTLGLLLMTVRELSASERYLRAGRWQGEGPYPLTSATLQGRKVGIAGLGRIGLAVAHRLEAFGVSICYHTRRPRTDIAYRHYADLTAMARDVDTMICILPGGEATRNLIDADVLKALGPDGILINMGRGTSVDEKALVAALDSGTILSAGLDVFANEPAVEPGLLEHDNVVLLPHVGSASHATRDAMANLVAANLVGWFADRKPLTPVAETPWPPA
ncbi:MAG: 2-hydroxyacid dehydrogenase [Alphaproteobacteria bacterium]